MQTRIKLLQGISKPLFPLFMVFAMGIFSTACDVVDYRTAAQQPTTNPQPTDTSRIVQRTLLYDFTGHTCGNCPRAHEEAASLKQRYGNQLVLVSIHCGFFAEPKNLPDGRFGADFRTTEGNAIDTRYGASAAGLPKGVIDQRKYSGQFLLNASAWGTAISQRLATTPIIGMEATVDQAESATPKLNLTLRADSPLPGDMDLFVMLTEDSIATWQKDYSKSPSDIVNYYQRDVFRRFLVQKNGFVPQAFAGRKEETVSLPSLGSPTAGGKFHVVAFLVNYDNEVQQVVEVKIK